MNPISDIQKNQYVILFIPIYYQAIPNLKLYAVTGQLTSTGFRDIDGYSIEVRYGYPIGWEQLPDYGQ